MTSTGSCGLCGRPISDAPADPEALDCGGDCAGCVQDAEGPAGNQFAFDERVGRGIIVRTDRDLDQYMVWSTIADGPTYVGPRAELLAIARFDEVDAIGERLDRAAADGTSMTAYDAGGYDAYGLIFDQTGWLPRQNFAAFADAFAREDEAGMLALITPFDQPHEAPENV